MERIENRAGLNLIDAVRISKRNVRRRGGIPLLLKRPLESLSEPHRAYFDGVLFGV